MSDQPVDPERPRGTKPFDGDDGYSGQDYSVAEEVAAQRAGASAPSRVIEDGRDLPPDAGRRPDIDAATGEVHGSGSGAGGGNPGEDFDSSSPSGDSYPVTGGEGRL
ncbi:hypothetical protein [Sphingomonas sp.]|jgi:hypothetical protein|uniref:hypothetical protein n=1 Tax=Sphingomonas sp. TaxID=28214 RepID=UPI002D7F8E67|nr:hypothetical protein [Sphingomonas sp.]HEU0043725.1 hypothetical protein [Sphingomonas sp.]